jgi:hypothetical protein
MIRRRLKLACFPFARPTSLDRMSSLFTLWRGERGLIVSLMLTVFFSPVRRVRRSVVDSKIDQLIAIVVETTENLDRANFRLKSKAKKFDGLPVGF